MIFELWMFVMVEKMVFGLHNTFGCSIEDDEE